MFLLHCYYNINIFKFFFKVKKPMRYNPSYLKTYADGLLLERIELLESKLNPCMLCPRRCGVNRLSKELGYCRAPYELFISSAFAHFGEEAPLVGIHGSGTIFLTHCNLKCIFCQNYEISILGDGLQQSYAQLADLMLELQKRSCHNINFVTPTHYVPQIVKALPRAIDGGLSIPLVYNCGGYESIEVIQLLEGIIDIYMPDIKFMSSHLSRKFCKAEDYPDVVKEVVKEMQRQVGDLSMDEEGIATHGLLIRHLVMPSCIEDTKKVLTFVRDEISENAYVNIMAQYHPCHNAYKHEGIARRITDEEYYGALSFAREIGLPRAATH